MITLRTRCRAGILGVCAAFVVGRALVLAPTAALAEAQIRGSQENVHIEARDSSVEEVLAALDDALSLHHRASAKLDKRISGTYEGPLLGVLKRILGGYDFFVKTQDGGVEITVVGPSAGVSLDTAASAVRLAPRAADADAPPPRAPSTVIEPDVPVSSVAAAQPPPAGSAVERRAPSATKAHSIRRRHGGYAVAAAKEQPTSPPRRLSSAGRGWRKASIHVRHRRVAHRAIHCCHYSSAPSLTSLYPVRPQYWPRWDDPWISAAVPFDRPRRWPRLPQHRRPGIAARNRSR